MHQPKPMNTNDNQQPKDYVCRHCDKHFSMTGEHTLGEFAKHLLADHHFGGNLTPEQIDRVCFAPSNRAPFLDMPTTKRRRRSLATSHLTFVNFRQEQKTLAFFRSQLHSLDSGLQFGGSFQGPILLAWMNRFVSIPSPKF